MKKIVIIGGGISGLALLHFLKKRLASSVQITLYERDSKVGGTIRSLKKDSCLFEWGPNGFLDNRSATLQLIDELGLSHQLIMANPESKKRYIQINQTLHAVSTNPIDFMSTPLLGWKDKISVLAGLFKNNISKNTSIYDYVSQRFSSNLAEIFIDSFVSGVYAGDIKRLHMASAFPKLKHRSFSKPRMYSFNNGMGELINELYDQYKNHIQINNEISSVPSDADITILATPAYIASQIVETTNMTLSRLLDEIPYAPVAVAGLLFKADAFKNKPEGFGYLIPSKENKEILGVLIESNVYAHRAGEGEIMLRVMLGGRHHPAIMNDTPERILAKAIKEIDETFCIVTNPLENFVKLWPKAIPQYELNYPQLRQWIAHECGKSPHLYLCANYLDGVSFNDCISNALILANSIKI